MAFAEVDGANRIIAWSEEQLDGMTVEFSNGDYVNSTATNGVQDFRIIDGVAVFDPTQETMDIIESEQAHTDRNAMLDMLPDAIADLSEDVSDNATDLAVVMNALAELSAIVSDLVDGA